MKKLWTALLVLAMALSLGLLAACSGTAVEGVSLDKESAIVEVGDTVQLTASVTPENADDTSVTYSSSSANIASVSESGLVTAKAYGTATITVTTTDGKFTDTFEITVYDKVITTSAELEAAINAQADGQHWYIQAGNYDVSRNDTIELESQTGWYFPITADNLTIEGNGTVNVYSTELSANGALASQNLISVYGDGVSIEGLNIACKAEVNKAVYVQGKNFTMKDCAIVDNTWVTADDVTAEDGFTYDDSFNGSLYFFGNVGNATIENVTLNKSYISTTSMTGGKVTLNNVTIDAAGVTMLNNAGFAVISGDVDNNVAVNGLTIRVNNEIDNIYQSVIKAAPAGSVVVLEEGTYDITETIFLSKAITLKGEGEVILDANDSWVDPDPSSKGNTSIITVSDLSSNAVTVDNVVIENITIQDAVTCGDDYAHGINIVNGNVTVRDVDIKNCDGAGMVLNGGNVVLEGVSFSGNEWGAVNIAYDTQTVDGEPTIIESVLTISDCTFDATADAEQKIYADSDQYNADYITITMDGDGITLTETEVASGNVDYVWMPTAE